MIETMQFTFKTWCERWLGVVLAVTLVSNASADFIFEAFGDADEGKGVFVDSPAMQEGSPADSFLSVEIFDDSVDTDNSPTAAEFRTAIGSFTLRHGNATIEGEGVVVRLDKNSADRIEFDFDISNLNVTNFSPGFGADSVVGISMLFNLFADKQIFSGDPTLRQLAGFNGLQLDSPNRFNQAGRVDFVGGISNIGRSEFGSARTIAIPEPSGLGIAGLICVVAVMRRKHRR